MKRGRDKKSTPPLRPRWPQMDALDGSSASLIDLNNTAKGGRLTDVIWVIDVI